MFQSAPRTFMRGDQIGVNEHFGKTSFARLTTSPVTSFNPRPALSCGATGTAEFIEHMVAAFQSAPRTFMRGDLLLLRIEELLTWFQSAPRTFMRGDLPE